MKYRQSARSRTERKGARRRTIGERVALFLGDDVEQHDVDLDQGFQFGNAFVVAREPQRPCWVEEVPGHGVPVVREIWPRSGQVRQW